MSGDMVRFLCRLDTSDTSVTDSDVLCYARRAPDGAADPRDADVIGVARTPKGQVPQTAHDEATFRERVETVATDVRWFDDPL